jgi:hypothetical protein
VERCPCSRVRDDLVPGFRLRGTGGTWTVDHAPNAGGQGFSDIPGGITAIDGQLWLAGMYTTATSNELPLIEHR